MAQQVHHHNHFAIRPHPPPKIKQVRRIPVNFDTDTGIMYPYHNSRPWIALTEGHMPLRIVHPSWELPAHKIAQMERDISSWNMLMENPQWHFAGVETVLESSSKEGASNADAPVPLAEAHTESIGYHYDHFAVFHQY